MTTTTTEPKTPEREEQSAAPLASPTKKQQTNLAEWFKYLSKLPGPERAKVLKEQMEEGLLEAIKHFAASEQDVILKWLQELTNSPDVKEKLDRRLVELLRQIIAKWNKVNRKKPTKEERSDAAVKKKQDAELKKQEEKKQQQQEADDKARKTVEAFLRFYSKIRASVVELQLKPTIRFRLTSQKSDIRFIRIYC